MLGSRSGVIFRYATTHSTNTATKTVSGFFTLNLTIERSSLGTALHNR